MNTTQYLTKIIGELTESVGRISQEDANQLVEKILTSKKVFVAGAGRSGFMVKSLAMRLTHMGIDANVVGETTTPGMTETDLLIIASGSGETKTLVAVAEKAKSIGGSVAIVTLSPDSTIGKFSDIIVRLSGARKDEAENTQTIQPMGSLFEQTLLLFFDSIILSIMEKQDLNSTNMYGRHANLE